MCKIVSKNRFVLGNGNHLELDPGVIQRYAHWKALSELFLYDNLS